MFIIFHMDNIDHPIRKDNGNGVELFFFLSSDLFFFEKNNNDSIVIATARIPVLYSV